MAKLQSPLPSLPDDYEVPVNLKKNHENACDYNEAKKNHENAYSEANIYYDLNENDQHCAKMKGMTPGPRDQYITTVQENPYYLPENGGNAANKQLLLPQRIQTSDKYRCYKKAFIITLILCFALATSTASFAWLFVRCRKRDTTNIVKESDKPSMTVSKSTTVALKPSMVVSKSTTDANEAASFSVGNGPVCPEDFKRAGKCYFISSDVVTRPEAERVCHQNSSDLLQINSKDEYDYITSHIPVAQSARNIAHRPESTCSASSEWDDNYSCSKAIDGLGTPGSSEWVIRQENAVGSWIKIDLHGNFEVTQVQVLTRCYREYQSKGFKMMFSDSSEEQGQLVKANGSDRSDCRGVDWQVYNFTSRVTSYVKIVITSVYRNYNNGLREVKVIGRPVSSFWTKGIFQDGSWLWGQLPLMGYELFESGVKTSAENGDCLSITSRGYFPSICNNFQKRKFICVRNLVNN